MKCKKNCKCKRHLTPSLPEVRAKNSASNKGKNKGRQRPDLAAWNRSQRGVPETPESNAKRSAALKGKRKSPGEDLVAAEYLAQGFTVLRNGYPDFTMVRGDEVVFVEVKTPYRHLSAEQEMLKPILERFGEYRVEVRANS